MRRHDDRSPLTAEQERAANEGAKAMMPLARGHAFLDYVLSALADSGITEVCIVTANDDDAVRARYASIRLSRLTMTFAHQQEPRGTADALLSARAFCGDDSFLMLNGDNYYSVTALQAVRTAPSPALAGYRAETLVLKSNIPIERVRSFALLRVNAQGNLTDIVEKPDAVTAAKFGASAPVSMNLWSFTPVIFDACERVTPSSRGELELQDAVRIGMHELGMTFRVVMMNEGVLDLSGRADVATVASRLANVEVTL